MVKERIGVIGCGEIGSAVIRSLIQKIDATNQPPKFEIVAYDVDKQKSSAFYGVTVAEEFPLGLEYYIICVWTTEQVINTLEQIIKGCKDPKLISIETTLDPNRLASLEYIYDDLPIAAFPHRLMPGDSEHQVFNLDRVLGGITKEVTKVANDFYSNFMDKKLIHRTDFRTAALSKVLENAYRYCEIVIAQEMSKVMEEAGFYFESVRQAANTKWNCDIRRAEKGVLGKCLPKDFGFFFDTFGGGLFENIWMHNNCYIEAKKND